jgi:hypothetical protein
MRPFDFDDADDDERLVDWGAAPTDWSDVEWHVDPESPRFRSWEAAERNVQWMNWERHDRDEYEYRVGHDEWRNVRRHRRWVGRRQPACDG